MAIGLLAMLSQVFANGQSFTYWYADIEQGSTNLYQVNLSGSDAHLKWMTSVPYTAHIAYDQMDQQLVIVNYQNGALQTLDVLDSTASPQDLASPSFPVGNFSAAAVTPSGKLLLGSETDQNIYSYDLSNGNISTYQTGNDVYGGDMAFLGTDLYLASRLHDKLYLVNPGSSNTMKGYVINEVTGLAAMESGDQLITSGMGSTQFNVYGFDNLGHSTLASSYTAQVMGDGNWTSFTMGAGDMASGMVGNSPLEAGCPNFKMYYSNFAQQGNPTSTIFSVNIVNDGVQLDSLFSVDHHTHIALNSDNGDLYLMNENGATLDTYDTLGNQLASVSTNPAIPGGVVEVAYNSNDGMIYVGRGTTIYTIDPNSGATAVFAQNIPVSGGDLFVDDAGNLFQASNSNGSKVYNITSGTPVEVVSLPGSVNGAAMTSDGGFVTSIIGTSNFYRYNADGSGEMALPVYYGASSFTLGFGDLASGCEAQGGGNSNQTCQNYKSYCINYGNGNPGQLFSLEISGNDVNMTEIPNVQVNGAHMAIDDSGLLYIVRGHKIDIYDPSSNSYVQQNILIQDASGSNLSGFPAAVFMDGVLYIAKGSNNTIYSVSISGSVATATPVYNAPVAGGDLIATSGANGSELWLFNRSQNKLYNVTNGGDPITVPLPQVNGAAVLPDGRFLLADGETNSNGGLYIWNMENGDLVNLNENGGPQSYFNGDLAGGCVAPGGETQVPPVGNCYASCLYGPGYVQGTEHDGSPLPSDRTDATKALGVPQGNDAPGSFVTLGYGGSITLCFDGAVLNGPGPDLGIVETSYGNPSYSSYPEAADVEVSQDGTTWYYIGTVELDGSVDISDASVNLDYIMYVRITNNDAMTSTTDGYDLDGVNVLNNGCGNENPSLQPQLATVQVENPSLTENGNSGSFQSWPNPSQGISHVQFEVPSTGNVNVEVFNMAGQRVATLFNAQAQGNQPYQVDFKGQNLPNGLYVIRMENGSDVTMHKILLAK